MDIKQHKIILYKNKYKEPGSKKPDFKGGLFHEDNREIKLFDVAGWANESKAGNKYLSLTFSDVWVKPETKAPKEEELIDDDIPF